MAKHILVHPDGKHEIIDIEKRATLRKIAVLTGVSGSGFQLMATSVRSDPFDLPVVEDRFVIVTEGQSTAHVGQVDTAPGGPRVVILDGVDAQIIQHHQLEGPKLVTLSQEALDNAEVSPGFAQLANTWHLGSGGQPLGYAVLAKSGQGPQILLDDEEPAREFEKEQIIVEMAEDAWGKPILDVIFNWNMSYWRDTAKLFGVEEDGTPVDYDASDMEHCLIDTTKRGTSDKGRGLYNPNAVMHIMRHIEPFIRAVDGEYYSEQKPDFPAPMLDYGVLWDGRIVDSGKPTLAELDEVWGAQVPDHQGKKLNLWKAFKHGDFRDGEKLSGGQVGTHPSLKSPGGRILSGGDQAFAMLIVAGYAEVSYVKGWEFSDDGSLVDMIVHLPPTATLSNIAEVRGRAEERIAAHHHQVMGMSMLRAGEANPRAIYHTGNTDLDTYPETHHATIEIVDRGSDVVDAATGDVVREGRVRVTPTQPFRSNDRVDFGRSTIYGSNIIHGWPDYDLDLHEYTLRAYEPRLHDGTDLGYPGQAVVPQSFAVFKQSTESVFDFAAVEPGSNISGGGNSFDPDSSGSPRHTFSGSAGSFRNAFDVSNDVLLPNRTYRVEFIVYAGEGVVADLYAQSGKNSGLTSGTTGGETKRISTDPDNPTTLTVEFTMGGPEDYNEGYVGIKGNISGPAGFKFRLLSEQSGIYVVD